MRGAITGGATVTTGMKGGAAWENDSRGREPAVSSVSTGQPGLNVPAAAVLSQHKPPDQAGQSADRLRGGSVAANEPVHSGQPGLMGLPQRPEASAAGRPVQPGSCTDVRARNVPKQALDAHLTMHSLDWIGEPGGQGNQPQPGNNNDGDGALRQASGALIETMGHPNNASFLLSFMDGGGAAKEGGGTKEQLSGSFRQPAPNGRSLASAMPPAGYPTAAAGGSGSSGSGRFDPLLICPHHLQYLQVCIVTVAALHPTCSAGTKMGRGKEHEEGILHVHRTFSHASLHAWQRQHCTLRMPVQRAHSLL